MLLPRSSFKVPKGLSFEIPDLLLVRAWAEFHDIRMEVELDFSAEGDEFEEMLGLFSSSTGFRRWMIWRSGEGIVAQPVVGRPRLFDTVSEALDVLIPAQDCPPGQPAPPDPFIAEANLKGGARNETQAQHDAPGP